MSHRYLQRAVKYSIIADLCVECTACRSECPVGCITGHPKKEHFIDLNLCIFCGGYFNTCKSYALVKNPDKCIMCRRCETMCNEVQTCGILSANKRGFDAFVGPAFNLDMMDTSCTFCGQ